MGGDDARCTRFMTSKSTRGRWYVSVRIVRQVQFCRDGYIYNEEFESFEKLVNKLLHDLPSPSEFANPRGWSSVQMRSPILRLRPGAAGGLPLHTT